MDAADAIAEVTNLGTLKQVFRWALPRQALFTPGDVVIQDEYVHDVRFRAPDGSALVFDNVTGWVHSVSVWDHEPTADELLTAIVAASCV